MKLEGFGSEDSDIKNFKLKNQEDNCVSLILISG